jgi:hypothetical protein
MKRPLQALCNENSLSFEDVLRTTALAESVISIFEKTLSEASGTVARNFESGAKNSAEQLDSDH